MDIRPRRTVGVHEAIMSIWLTRSSTSSYWPSRTIRVLALAALVGVLGACTNDSPTSGPVEALSPTASNETTKPSMNAPRVGFEVIDTRVAAGPNGSVLSVRLQVTNNTEMEWETTFFSQIGCAIDGTFSSSYPDVEPLGLSDGSNNGVSLSPGTSDVLFATPITVETNMTVCSDGSMSTYFIELPSGMTADLVDGPTAEYQGQTLLALPVDLTEFI